MNLIVIRHGETDLNKEDRLQGSKGPDEPLNETGRAQIVALRDGLLVAPVVILTSPLRRATETTAIINERFHVPITIAPDLAERDFGTLSGKPRSEVDGELIRDDLEGHYDYRPYGGESVEDVRVRTKRFLATLPLESTETMFAITHRGIIRILYDLYPNEVTAAEILPGSLHVFRINTVSPR